MMRSDRLWAILFPPVCPFCNQLLKTDVSCCPACRSHLPVSGVRRYRISQSGSSFDCYSPFLYQASVRQAILNWKYHGATENEIFFAEALSEVLPKTLTFDRVLFVPAYHKKHTRLLRLAKRVAIAKGYPKPAQVLVKRKGITAQHTLTYEERLQNVQNAYFCPPEVNLSGERILLLDDILTTGATLSACAAALYRAGAREVTGCAIARTKRTD